MISLSVLIPTYNTVCYDLVACLQQQAAAIGMNYEIIVADDGSTDDTTVEANKAINDLPCSLYIIRSKNEGRSRIRNFLSRQARYDYLLFIDSDMVVINDDYLRRYVLSAGTSNVIDGGYVVNGDRARLRGNLRYRYEMANSRNGSAAERQESPYNDFHTSNFLVRRELFLRFPLDERFLRYGYEDVLWGKTLHQHGITIEHIDNALSFETFESNDAFIAKTEEGLRTLHEFSADMSGYSKVLAVAHRVARLRLTTCLAWLHRLAAPLLKWHLRGNNPSLLLFNIYKLLYYCRIDDDTQP